MRISKGPALVVLPKRAAASARPVDDEPRALAGRLRDVGQATRALARALDDAGLTERMREAPVPLQNARSRRTSPKQTVTDLLLACEALASVTGPQALVNGETGRVYDEARRLARVLRALTELAGDDTLPEDDVPVTNDASAATGGDAEGSTPLPLLAILRAGAVRSALSRLADLLAELAAVERAQPGRDRWTLRIGTRILIPLSIVLITVALILFFAGGIVFATGAVAISPRGVVFSNPIDNTAPERTDSHTTATVGQPTATPGSRGTPGATSGGKTGTGAGTGGAPGAAPTATPAGGSPGSGSPTPPPAPPPAPTPPPLVVDVTPTTMAACQQKSESFEISYTSGQGALSWAATAGSGVQVSLDGTTGWASQVSGTLQPLTRAKVFVHSPTGASGAVTVTFSAGLPSRTVTIDNSTCTAGIAPDTHGSGHGPGEEAERPSISGASSTPALSGASSSPVQEDSSSGHA
jgi:hypothetical protein